MRNIFTYVIAAFIGNRILPVIWQQGEFVGITMGGFFDWVFTPATYVMILFVIVISLMINYRQVKALSLSVNLISGFILGVVSALVFLPYDGMNQWHIPLLGYDIGLILAVAAIMLTLFVPFFLDRTGFVKKKGT